MQVEQRRRDISMSDIGKTELWYKLLYTQTVTNPEILQDVATANTTATWLQEVKTRLRPSTIVGDGKPI